MAKRKNNRLRLRLIGAAVLLLIGGSGWVWWHLRQWTPARTAFPVQGIEVGGEDGPAGGAVGTLSRMTSRTRADDTGEGAGGDDRDDATVFHADVAFVGGCARAVDDRSAANNHIMHGRLSSSKVGKRLSH